MGKASDGREKYTIEAVSKAIIGSGGIISTIAKRLGCQWSTASKLIERYPDAQVLYRDEKEAILDLCEGTLYQSVKNGDVQSSKWILATAGKKRGWSEKLEIEQTGEVIIIPAPQPKVDKTGEV